MHAPLSVDRTRQKVGLLVVRRRKLNVTTYIYIYIYMYVLHIGNYCYLTNGHRQLVLLKRLATLPSSIYSRQ
jgi:hypothetical protein